MQQANSAHSATTIVPSPVFSPNAPPVPSRRLLLGAVAATAISLLPAPALAAGRGIRPNSGSEFADWHLIVAAYRRADRVSGVAFNRWSDARDAARAAMPARPVQLSPASYGPDAEQLSGATLRAYMRDRMVGPIAGWKVDRIERDACAIEGWQNTCGAVRARFRCDPLEQASNAAWERFDAARSALIRSRPPTIEAMTEKVAILRQNDLGDICPLSIVAADLSALTSPQLAASTPYSLPTERPKERFEERSVGQVRA